MKLSRFGKCTTNLLLVVEYDGITLHLPYAFQHLNKLPIKRRIIKKVVKSFFNSTYLSPDIVLEILTNFTSPRAL